MLFKIKWIKQAFFSMTNLPTSCFQFNQCPKSLAHPRWGASIPQYPEDNTRVGSHSSWPGASTTEGEEKHPPVTAGDTKVSLARRAIRARRWAPRGCFTVRYCFLPQTFLCTEPPHWATDLCWAAEPVVLQMMQFDVTGMSKSWICKYAVEQQQRGSGSLQCGPSWEGSTSPDLVLLLSISIPEEQ